MAVLTKMVGFIQTSNPENAKRFYGKVLGFRLTGDDNFALVFDATGTTIPADDIGRLERIAMRPAGRVSDRALPGSITAFNAGAAE